MGYWMRPENGGHLSRLCEFPGSDDLAVLNATSDAAGAAAISECRVDAVAFDGIGHLTGPVLRVSPGAKVISLRWRTWDQWVNSSDNFRMRLALSSLFIGLSMSSLKL